MGFLVERIRTLSAGAVAAALLCTLFSLVLRKKHDALKAPKENNGESTDISPCPVKPSSRMDADDADSNQDASPSGVSDAVAGVAELNATVEHVPDVPTSSSSDAVAIVSAANGAEVNVAAPLVPMAESSITMGAPSIESLAKAISHKVQEQNAIRRLLSSDVVRLDKLGLDGSDTQIIADILKARTSPPDFLSLSGNISLGLAGAQAMASLLSCPSQRLQSLILSDCLLMEEGVEILACSLRHNKSLKVLDLRHNCLTDLAAQALAAAVAYQSVLESIYLNNAPWCETDRRNTIGDDGAWALAFAFAESAHLNKVSLVGNEVTEIARDRIIDVVGRRMKL